MANWMTEGRRAFLASGALHVPTHQREFDPRQGAKDRSAPSSTALTPLLCEVRVPNRQEAQQI